MKWREDLDLILSEQNKDKEEHISESIIAQQGWW